MDVAVHTVCPTDSVLRAVTLMRDAYVNFVCVCSENGHPLGVVSAYDVIEGVCSVDRRPSEVPVHEVMNRRFTSCAADDDVDQLIRLLRGAGAERALIVDGMGRLLGVVTWADLLHYIAPIQAEKLALVQVEREFHVRGRGGSTPPPPPH